MGADVFMLLCYIVTYSIFNSFWWTSFVEPTLIHKKNGFQYAYGQLYLNVLHKYYGELHDNVTLYYILSKFLGVVEFYQSNLFS